MTTKKGTIKVVQLKREGTQYFHNSRKSFLPIKLYEGQGVVNTEPNIAILENCDSMTPRSLLQMAYPEYVYNPFAVLQNYTGIDYINIMSIAKECDLQAFTKSIHVNQNDGVLTKRYYLIIFEFEQ